MDTLGERTCAFKDGCSHGLDMDAHGTCHYKQAYRATLFLDGAVASGCLSTSHVTSEGMGLYLSGRPPTEERLYVIDPTPWKTRVVEGGYQNLNGAARARLSSGHKLPSVACSYAHVVLLNMPLRASVASHSFSRWSGCFRVPFHEPRDLRGDGAAPLRPHSQPSSPPARVLKEQGLKC